MSFYGLVDGSDASLKKYLSGLSGVDQVGADARAAMLATRSIKAASKRWAIDTAISMVDLTTLEGADTPGKVQALCTKAVRPDPTDVTVPSVGAVCVYNDMVGIARKHLDLIGGAHVGVADERDGPAVSPVAAVRPSLRHVLLSTAADGPVSPRAGRDFDDRLIDEFHHLTRKEKGRS